MFRLALWRALISEIQELTVCCITPIFVPEVLLSTYIPGLIPIESNSIGLLLVNGYWLLVFMYL